MAAQGNRAVFFRQYVPSGLPEFGKNFTIEEYPEPVLGEGQIAVKLLFISVDPYLRSRMKDIKSYFPGFQIDQPGDSGILVEVTESKSDKYKAGERYAGYGKWIERQVLNESELAGFWGVKPEHPASYALGILGMPGATAYFGYLELCLPKEGETLVVSGAAGAVGLTVCQLGKLKGCRVIAIAGSDDKCEHLKSLGVDVALNYKQYHASSSPTLAEAIRAAAPQGVDQYFDNVGGEIKDAVYANLNGFARISACGAISDYNNESPTPGKTWEWAVITKQLRIEGFLVFRWRAQWEKAFQELSNWIQEGKIKYEETFVDGLENVIEAFNKMMNGENTGKMVCRI